MVASLRTAALFLGIIAVWSFNYLITAWQTAGVDPTGALGLRCLIAAVFFLPMLRRTALSWRAAAIAVTMIIIPGIGAYYALLHIPSGFEAVIYSATTPILIGLIRTLCGIEPLDRRTIPASLIGGFGLALAAHVEIPSLEQWLWIGVLLITNVVFAYGNVLLERWYNDKSTVAGVIVISALLLLPMAIPVIPHLSLTGWIETVVLALLTTYLGSLLIGQLISDVGAERAAYSDLPIGVFALFIGMSFNHEPFRGIGILGCAIALFALWYRLSPVTLRWHTRSTPLPQPKAVA